MVHLPRLLIAGTHSGVGKTTVAIGLMAALRHRGVAVQPFKVGPDYIDPGFHTLATARVSRNLDTWLLKDTVVRGLFQEASADAQLAMIEGVMGLFDGHASTSDRGSTAELAKLLRVPVILVVDASGMARSAAAMVQGYLRFDPQVHVAGVIFNKIRERHFQLLREALHRYTDCPALGYLPPDAELAIPERHLGLIPAQEDQSLARVQARLGEVVAHSIDLEAIMRIAHAAPPLLPVHRPGKSRGGRSGTCRIGVARDRAFHFYYQENLDLLRDFGAELVAFSPLRDQRLPEGLDALYLGGGFPEVLASELAHNEPLRREIKRVVEEGLPTYAECGGLMYLAKRLVDQQGHRHAMVGVLPGTVRMTDRLQHFGYVTLIPQRDTILARAHDPIKGHEFHYSVWDCQVPEGQAAYVVVRHHEGRRLEGFVHANLLASYIHVHFLTNSRWARGFVASARRFRMRVQGVVCAVLVIGSSSGTAWAQVPSRAEEVVVTATRARLPRGKVTKSVSVVSAEQIERQQADTALDVLRNVPGVFVRQSGAIGRTTSTVIRGSTDDQVVVLLDGVEVSSPTLGSFNWSTLPADFIERIEVLRGSASTLYGSKAIGGVINIITKRGEGPMRTSYQQEFGTLRTFKETIATQAEIGPIRYHLGTTRLDSRGLSNGDDVELTHVTVAGTVQLAKWLSVDVALNNNDSHVGIDDGAFLPDPNRFIEREHLALSTTLKAHPIELWEQELRFSFNDDDTLDVDVADPGTKQATAKTGINTDRYGMDWLHRVGFGRWGLLTAGFELKDEEAESTGFDKTVFQWAWFLQHQFDLTDRLTLIGGVRNLRHNFFGHETTSEASVSYRVPVTETRLRANFSQGFRAPDLNDLFFPNFGNPDLQPEESHTFEIGVGQDWWQGRLGGEITWFHTEVARLIQSVRVTSTTSQAQNLNEAEMEGVELEAHIEPGFGLRLSGNWTYVDAEEEPSKEELVRIPKHTLGVTLDYDFLKRWRFNLHAGLVDHREESVATNRRMRTKGYTKLDAGLSCQVTPAFQLYGRVENLFDRHYSEVLGFPAPGTLFFIGGKVEI